MGYMTVYGDLIVIYPKHPKAIFYPTTEVWNPGSSAATTNATVKGPMIPISYNPIFGAWLKIKIE